MTALIDKLKTELGARNVSKYYEGDDGDAALADFITEGIESLSAGRPLAMKATVTVPTEVKQLAVPEGFKLVTEIYTEDQKLDPMKEFDVYAGDRYGSVFDQYVPLDKSEYPGKLETQTFGEWTHDLTRELILFPRGITGELQIHGFGIPAEAVLNAKNRRMVVQYATAMSLRGAIPKMLAAYDIEVDGAVVKEKTEEYRTEADKLMDEFNAYTNVPYMSFGR